VAAGARDHGERERSHQYPCGSPHRPTSRAGWLIVPPNRTEHKPSFLFTHTRFVGPVVADRVPRCSPLPDPSNASGYRSNRRCVRTRFPLRYTERAFDRSSGGSRIASEPDDVEPVRIRGDADRSETAGLVEADEPRIAVQGDRRRTVVGGPVEG